MAARILFALARAARRAAGAARRETAHLIEVIRDREYVGPRLCARCESYTTHASRGAVAEWRRSGVMPCRCGYGALTPVFDEEPTR
ncbi:hypothetical protein [Thermomonospora cellulosilytica]|uniref:Uncharacterized protein n=1 Tax=Thermomonospora cellulosilytica TaxID=1411118 RepID=A0A7W3MXH6_9ACTN|nr:hypothetical protein [Thermomonospora cellulosilytica]MBA9003700.1 hypothetical protein [Thermomonospora cellulosilytica]